MANAEYSAHEDEHEIVLAVRGEVDIATADELRRRLDAVIRAAGDRPVVVDLADVTFLDSTGLAALFEEAITFRPRRLTLRRVSGPVRRVLEVTATLDSFDLESP
jgi:anti-anti-sigma factor